MNARKISTTLNDETTEEKDKHQEKNVMKAKRTATVVRKRNIKKEIQGRLLQRKM